MGGCLDSNVGQCNENRVKYFTLYVSQEGVVVGDGQGVRKVSVVAAGMRLRA